MGTRLDAVKPLGENQDFVLSTAAESGVRWTVVLVVPKVRWVCASLMAADGDASSKDVIKGLREARCIAKLMVVGNVVYLLAVRKGLKVAHRFVKLMAAESGVCMTVAGFARKACTVGPTFAWLMAAASGVPSLVVPKAPVAGPIAV